MDAIRIQALRDNTDPSDTRYRIDVAIEEEKISVRDNGTGMSAGDLRSLFWTIGASGKRTPEALAAGCVGMFGIGGFANFGVCEALEVVSQTQDAPHRNRTRLSKGDIEDVRFENGAIDVFKRGFKLCATQIGSTIGVSGRLDCDRFVPTAGLDSLNSGTTSLLGRIVPTLETVAVEAILESPERIAQHTRLTLRAEGAVQLDRPFHELYGEVYFPIPTVLERYLVPRGSAEIRLELHCDWIDMRTAKHWTPKDPGTT